MKFIREIVAVGDLLRPMCPQSRRESFGVGSGRE